LLVTALTPLATPTAGTDAEDTLLSRFYLAYVLDGQGRYAEAEAEYQAVLETQLRTLGPDHPSLLTTRNEIVFALLGRDVMPKPKLRHGWPEVSV
jgi:hypothetical protein